jgi:hypothetical protein
MPKPEADKRFIVLVGAHAQPKTAKVQFHDPDRAEW